MRGPDVAAFAARHKLKRLTIADLIAYRQAREKLVDRIGEFTVTTEIGPLKGYAYMTHFDQVHHMALVHGRIDDGRNMPTRLHRANIIRDMFGGANTVSKALRHFKREGRGVIVVLRDGSVGVPVAAIPKNNDKNGDKNGEAGSEAERQRQWREIGLGAQILRDLGISSIRLLTSAKHRYVGLAGFGIEIVSTEPIQE
jgi:3,4-dihydroxy 2-butanone 4-phosphate synthase/GTP cyclohydrolase II